MLVQKNLARTTQPARPDQLQTKITNVCVFPDFLAMIGKTVLIHSITKSGLTQISNEKDEKL